MPTVVEPTPLSPSQLGLGNSPVGTFTLIGAREAGLPAAKAQLDGGTARPPIPGPETSAKGHQPEPTGKFTTWSLFLVSDQAWLRDNSKRIASLFESYAAFARSIGERHAAVWFGDSAALRAHEKDPAADPEGAVIDTDACARFAEKLDLDRSKSPHVLVTTAFPDINGTIGNYVLLELNGLEPRAVEKLLASMANILEHAHLGEITFKSRIWWLGWESVCTRALEKIGGFTKEIDLPNGKLKWSRSTPPDAPAPLEPPPLGQQEPSKQRKRDKKGRSRKSP